MKSLIIGLASGIAINTAIQLIFRFPLQISVPNGIVIGIVSMLVTLKIEDSINKKKWKKIREIEALNAQINANEIQKTHAFKIIPENIIYLTYEEK